MSLFRRERLRVFVAPGHIDLQRRAGALTFSRLSRTGPHELRLEAQGAPATPPWRSALAIPSENIPVTRKLRSRWRSERTRTAWPT